MPRRRRVGRCATACYLSMRGRRSHAVAVVFSSRLRLSVVRLSTGSNVNSHFFAVGRLVTARTLPASGPFVWMIRCSHQRDALQ
eukprot:12308874-Alexandrium_andersonii.AAC.1